MNWIHRKRVKLEGVHFEPVRFVVPLQSEHSVLGLYHIPKLLFVGMQRAEGRSAESVARNTRDSVSVVERSGKLVWQVPPGFSQVCSLDPLSSFRSERRFD